MGYDDVIVRLGDFGRYQKSIYFLLCLTAIPCAIHKLAGVFLLAKPDFRCALPFENETVADYGSFPETNWSRAYHRDELTAKWQTCAYYAVDYSTAYLNGSSQNAPNTTTTKSCNRLLYDRSRYANSAITEWNMVCDRSFMAASSDALFMVGVLLGSLVFGHLSDRYGRKPIFFVSLLIQVVFGVAAGIAPEYVTYTLSRMVVGSTTSGVFLVAYVIALEMVGPQKRLFAGIVIMMFFSLGYMLTAVFAYFVHDWRWFQIAITLPGLIFMAYYWIIPESPRWLLLNGRTEEAVANIGKAAKFNGVSLKADSIRDLLDDGEAKKSPQKKTSSIIDFLRFPNLRRKFLLISFDWFVASGTYYSLSWNTNNLGGNPLVNFVIFGAVELPAYSFLLCTLNRWGRRTILCGCMLATGIALLLTIAVPKHMDWLLISLAILGKMAITACCGTVYIFAAEQYPTEVRSVGLGASSMVSRFGGIFAPFINLLADVWKPLPLIILGALTFIGGLCSLQLPETHNRPTLETIAEGEKFGSRRRPNVPDCDGLELKEVSSGEKQPLNAPSGDKAT